MGELTHYHYLEELIKSQNLKLIGERPEHIVAIFTEPKWLKQGNCKLNECPDVFLLYDDGKWVIIELKGHRNKRRKATRQIRSGARMLNQLFFVPTTQMTGKFVTYHVRKGYEYSHITI